MNQYSTIQFLGKQFTELHISLSIFSKGIFQLESQLNILLFSIWYACQLKDSRSLCTLSVFKNKIELMDIGDLQIIRLLGQGVSGRCYLAKNIKSEELCVVKQISLQGMQEENIQKTEREVKILELLNHSNIVRFRQSFLSENNLNIVMEYAEGGDLQTKIRDAKISFSESQILQWFSQICLALKHVHQNRIIHRDIKSQNIFLTNEGKIKLGDFGISKTLKLTFEKSKSVVGTPYYMSPEICQNRSYSYKTDIWSLGVVMYELCTLRLPFQAESLAGLVMKVCKGYFRPIPLHYSEAIRKLITSMLQVKPQKRPSIEQILKSTLIQKTLQKIRIKQLGIKDVEIMTPKMQKDKIKQHKEKMRERAIQLLQLNGLQSKRYVSPEVNTANRQHSYSNNVYSPLKTPQYKRFSEFFEQANNITNLINNKPRTSQKGNRSKVRHEKSESCITPKIKRPEQQRRVKNNFSLYNSCKKKNESSIKKSISDQDKKKRLIKNQIIVRQLDGIRQHSDEKSEQDFQYGFHKIDSMIELKKPISMREGRSESRNLHLNFFTSLETLETLILEKVGRDNFEKYTKMVQENLGFCEQIGEAKGLLCIWYGMKNLL